MTEISIRPTNRSILEGRKNLFCKERCVGATILRDALKKEGLEYEDLVWGSTDGYLKLKGEKIYKIVKAYRNGKNINLMRLRPRLFRRNPVITFKIS